MHVRKLSQVILSLTAHSPFLTYVVGIRCPLNSFETWRVRHLRLVRQVLVSSDLGRKREMEDRQQLQIHRELVMKFLARTLAAPADNISHASLVQTWRHLIERPLESQGGLEQRLFISNSSVHIGCDGFPDILVYKNILCWYTKLFFIVEVS